MEEKNELGDIILNKGSSQGGSKKVILAAATLGVILIIVVLLMNSLNSDSQENLPQASLPPKPAVVAKVDKPQKDETLFEDVEVIDEVNSKEDQKLEEIAKKLKAQSKAMEVEEVEEVKVVQPKPESKPKKVAKRVLKKAQTHTGNTRAKPKTVGRKYYVQVGSFTRYQPNKDFLNSIKKEGYDYFFHTANVRGRSITKVIVGPFSGESEARTALKNIRKHIEKGAFLTKL